MGGSPTTSGFRELPPAEDGTPAAALARQHSSPWVRFVLNRLSAPGVSWLMLAGALLATGVVCHQVWRRQSAQRQARFESEVVILHGALQERLHSYSQLLEGIAGLFAASVEVEEREFHAYVAALDLNHRHPGLLGLGFVEHVPHARRDEFLRTARTTNPERPLEIWPAGDRPDYFVVRFLEPPDPNRTALGFDVGSETIRRTAALAACDSAAPVLTGKLELVQAPAKPGAILFRPVYATGTAPSATADRRTSLTGLVYVAFVVDDLLAGVQHLAKSPLACEIFAGTEPSPAALLASGGPPHPRDAPTTSSPLEVFGQTWTVRCHSTADQGKAALLPVGLLAAGGTCLSALLFGVVRSMATTGRRALELATAMTAEIRRHEAALRTSEERLAMVIEGSSDGIWDWNITTNETYFSPRWKSMLGYHDHEIDNTFEAWKTLLHPADREHALAVVNDYFEGKSASYQLEHRLRHKDGSYRWILARGVAARDPAGKPLRMAGSHVDLTELKQAEQDLRSANAELLRSQATLQQTLAELRASHAELHQAQLDLIQAAKLESVGTLAAGVAHEVKNPLQVMLMGLDFLDRRLGPTDEPTRTSLADMRDAVLRADAITRELLQFSAPTRFTPRPADLEQVLERALRLLRADLAKGHVALVKEFAGRLPQVAVDAPRIQQVFINLVVNALQAMNRQGTLRITTGCGQLAHFLPDRGGPGAPLQPTDEVVVVRLLDSGPGIAENQLARSFDPFFTTKPPGSGTGLGLSVVRRIIDLHRALIDLRNSPHGGLEVTLAFAALPQPAANPPLPLPA